MTLEQAIGATLVLLFLADVFLTVLYARAGTGLLAPYWTRAWWVALRGLARLFGRRRGAVLSFAGPIIVVSLIGFWALGLTLGSALLIRPELGIAIRPSSGGTPTDLVTAMLVAGNSLSIVGGGDYAPHTTATRLLYLANSLIGASVLSLVLSYLVQIYSALRERNAFTLAIDIKTEHTGDAAIWLARLMPHGEQNGVTSELSEIVRSLTAIKEAHHFYPLLFYFRFEQPNYAVVRSTAALLELAALIESLLDQRRYAALIDHSSVGSLRRSAQLLLITLDREIGDEIGALQRSAEDWRFRQCYLAAASILKEAGVVTRTDGIDLYVRERAAWEPPVERVMTALGYVPAEKSGNPSSSRGIYS